MCQPACPSHCCSFLSSTPPSLISPLGFLDLPPRGPLTRLTQLRKQTFFPPHSSIIVQSAPWEISMLYADISQSVGNTKLILFVLKNMWNLRFPVGTWRRSCRSTPAWVSTSMWGAGPSNHLWPVTISVCVVSCFHTFPVRTSKKCWFLLLFSGWLIRCFA